MGLFSRGLGFFKEKKTFEANERISSYLTNTVNSGILLNVDGSVTPQVFEYVVPAGKNAWIKRLTVAGSNEDIEMSNFLGIAPLTNGVEAMILDNNNNVIFNYTAINKIKTTLSLALLNGDSIASTIDKNGAGQVDSVLFGNDFKENSGEELFMREGWKFRVIVNDNLTGINIFLALIRGVLVDKF